MEAATLPAVPDRSLEQRMAALEKAQRYRTFRAQVKRKLKLGANPLPYLLEPPAAMMTMRVFDLMLALPSWGRIKVNRALVRCRISPSKTLGGLSERQRDELAKVLRGA